MMKYLNHRAGNALEQGWATPGTLAELGMRALILGTRAKTGK